jgi:RNA polymerase sigma factor (sigma-70 family)
MQPSDAELVLACRRRDDTAWELLIERYKRLVYAIPRRAGLNEDQAAEVFQRVFIRLLNNVDQIEHPERVSAWLVTTARRETWRASKHARAASLPYPNPADHEDDEPELIDSAPLPDELLLRLEEQRLIREAIEALDERCRTMLTLLFYTPTPPSYAALAAHLGLKTGSVGSLRERCLQKLLRALDDAGWEGP